MSKRMNKVLLALAVSTMTVLPVLANSTDVTIQADVEDVLSVQLERVTDSVTVSGDDIDPTSSFAGNEVLNFGAVNPLALNSGAIINRALTATNGTTGTVKAMVIDTAGKVYKADGTGSALPKATNDGAVYFVENSLQVRALRTGGANTLIDVSNTGAFKALVDVDTAYNFADGQTINGVSFLDKVGTIRAGGLSTIANNTPLPVDLGISVPFSQPVGNSQTTVITFTGT
jgi:hypothetical protein